MNFEYVSSFRRRPEAIPFCPLTITGSGTGKQSRHMTQIYNDSDLEATPVGLCGLCGDGLVPSYRAARLVCLLRCGHQMHSGCIERTGFICFL